MIQSIYLDLIAVLIFVVVVVVVAVFHLYIEYNQIRNVKDI